MTIEEIKQDFINNNPGPYGAWEFKWALLRDAPFQEPAFFVFAVYEEDFFTARWFARFGNGYKPANIYYYPELWKDHLRAAGTTDTMSFF